MLYPKHSISVLLPVLLLALATTSKTQTCGPVTGADVTGECLNINTDCCDGFYTAGFCPGPANIQCCTSVQRCRNNAGFCNDINHVSCDSGYVSGLCPGPNNVRCCEDGTDGFEFCTAGH
ncbi:hypothetical protein GGX14DRAFT_544551 [Mycena pura]|uniref:Uncharacterized protein n=1 Tax=Mycena pura TaxID=153505 RepID=A0AAD6V7S8_9AGAR|nr:hypothetical protein GGX14DRAFT_544551 [Mycena pura]